MALAHAAPTSSGDGELTNNCLQQKTKLRNCNDSQLVTQFYFDSRQNRCRGYHTCPLPSSTPNLFQSRAECTAACPGRALGLRCTPASNYYRLVYIYSYQLCCPEESSWKRHANFGRARQRNSKSKIFVFRGISLSRSL